MILHAGSCEGFIPNALILCGTNMDEAYADYHKHMNSEVFEKWFESKLLPNLNGKCAIVLDNASYHSRQLHKIPTMATTKGEMLAFMRSHDISVPHPLPTKPILMDLIKLANIEKCM